MTDLVEFVRAALDEDERVARAAEPAPWTAHEEAADPDEGYVAGPDGYVLVYNEGTVSLGTAAHIARHDPARVLADVAAKRAILELHNAVPEEEYCSEDEQRKPCQTLRLLAQPFAGRPGWREEWAT
jgi:hypothetical protein